MIDKKFDDMSLADRVMRRNEMLRGDRKTWENHWQEVMFYTVPRKDDVTFKEWPGNKKGAKVYDSTAILSNEFLAGALHSMLTSPNQHFFGLSTGDELLDDVQEVREWMEACVRIIHDTLNNSNFQTEMHELYLDMGSIGTSCMDIEEDDDTDVRFYTRPIREVAISENNKGVVDTVYREFEMSVRNLIEEFGEKFLPTDVLRLQHTEPERKFTIIHAVEPNIPRISGVPKNRKVRSVYVLKEPKHILRKSGFHEFPYVVPRWTKTAGEVYGRSSGMKALPDIKMINQMMKTVIQAAQKTVDPPLMVSDDGFVLPLKTFPGGVNYRRAGSQERIETFGNDARIDFGYQMMEDIRNRIREAFFVDQMQLSPSANMTATEVMQRTEERMRLLGPMLGRQQSELLKPLVERVFNILLRRGKLPAAPEELQGRELKVEYVSLVAKAQRAGEAQNFLRAMEILMPLGQIDPSVFDNLNADAVFTFISKTLGLPAKVSRGADEISELREQRAEQQARAEQQQSDLAETQAIKNLQGVMQQ
jgi:hypothetical protein